MSDPLFSIITINRNNADGLRATMQSVLTQDFSDYEYIIIDGASTDGSVDVIREFLAVPEYAAKISYWVSERDSGIYNAMNKGIRHAKGEFVNMMNSGDTMLSEVLGRVAKIAREHKGEVLYGVSNYVKCGEFISADSGIPSDVKNGMSVHHQAIFIPMMFHNKYGLYDEFFKIAADYDMITKFYADKCVFTYLNLVICNFEVGGVSSGRDPARLEENKIIQKRYGFYCEQKFATLKTIVKLLLPGWIVLVIKKYLLRKEI